MGDFDKSPHHEKSMKKESTSAKAMADKKNKEVKSDVIEFDKQKIYSLEEGIELTKKLSKTKFDASVEAHFRLGIDAKKGDQQIRTAVSLPTDWFYDVGVMTRNLGNVQEANG